MITIQVLTEIKKIDEQIEKLYESRNELVKGCLAATSSVVNLNEDNKKKAYPGITKNKDGLVVKMQGAFNIGGEKPWARLTIVDNQDPFQESDIIYRTAKFSRFEAKIEYLKNEPKEK